MDHFAFATDLRAQLLGRKCGGVGILQRAFGGCLVDQRHKDKCCRTDQGQHTHHRMKDKDANEKQRRPRQIKQRHQGRRRDQALHRLKVTQTRCSLSWRAVQRCGFEHSGKYTVVHFGLKTCADPAHHTATDEI